MQDASFYEDDNEKGFMVRAVLNYIQMGTEKHFPGEHEKHRNQIKF